MPRSVDQSSRRKSIRRTVSGRNSKRDIKSISDLRQQSVRTAEDDALGPLIKEFKTIMMNRKGNEPLDAYIVPNFDAHASPYLSAPDQRLMFLTGFTGSAGTAIIFRDSAAFWTDYRYYAQAVKELGKGWTIFRIGDPEAISEVEHIKTSLKAGDVVGSDAKLVPHPIWLSLKKELKQYDIRLIHVSTNLVDLMWGNAKPELLLNPVLPLDLEFTGRTVSSKLEEVRSKMAEKSADILILNQLDDIAWLLNLRGTDIPYCPVFIGFAVVSMTTVDVFTEKRRMQYKALLQFVQENIDIRFVDYGRFYEFVKHLREYPLVLKIWLGPTVSYYLYNLIPESKRILEPNPIEWSKCIKNPAEVKGMEQAHVKDGVALVQFLIWLEEETNRRGVTEIEAAEKLDTLRELEYGYMGRSFPTVSASGVRSAILNYEADPNSSHIIGREEIYLIDSGAQMIEGTTDVARTLFYGEPSDFMMTCYTRVFKGLVAVSSQIFPKGIQGRVLDTLARKCLWDVGIDYKHGSGHGIGKWFFGCFLYAHESPIGMSWKPFPEECGLSANMFLTIEPGCYSEGEFGIRIENVLQTVETETQYNFNETFLAFKTITLCPIQTKLLDLNQLTEQELKFLNSYHAKVRETLTPPLVERLLTVEIEWLNNSTKTFGAPDEPNRKPEDE